MPAVAAKAPVGGMKGRSGQAVIGITSESGASVEVVFIAAFALLRMITSTQWQLWCKGRQEALVFDANGCVAAIGTGVDVYCAIRRWPIRVGCLVMAALAVTPGAGLSGFPGLTFQIGARLVVGIFAGSTTLPTAFFAPVFFPVVCVTTAGTTQPTHQPSHEFSPPLLSVRTHSLFSRSFYSITGDLSTRFLRDRRPPFGDYTGTHTSCTDAEVSVKYRVRTTRVPPVAHPP